MVGRTRAGAAGVSAALLLGVALGAPAPAGSVTPAPRVNLRIAIAASAANGAPSRTWRLRCAPSAGDWPAVATACRRLTSALLLPITHETRDLGYITNQPVRIRGSAFGHNVDLRFPARGSSTRRARLKALRSALGAAAYAEALRRSR